MFVRFKSNNHVVDQSSENIPTEEQVDVLWQISEKLRLLYNYALKDIKPALHNEKCSVKYVGQANKLPDFKARNPEFNVVYSKVSDDIEKAWFELSFILRTS